MTARVSCRIALVRGAGRFKAVPSSFPGPLQFRPFGFSWTYTRFGREEAGKDSQSFPGSANFTVKPSVDKDVSDSIRMQWKAPIPLRNLGESEFVFRRAKHKNRFIDVLRTGLMDDGREIFSGGYVVVFSTGSLCVACLLCPWKTLADGNGWGQWNNPCWRCFCLLRFASTVRRNDRQTVVKLTEEDPGIYSDFLYADRTTMVSRIERGQNNGRKENTEVPAETP